MKEGISIQEIQNKLLDSKPKINNLDSLINLQRKEEKLFGNKSFLEIILGLIKNTQNDIIMNEKNSSNNIYNIKNIINVLFNDFLFIGRQLYKSAHNIFSFQSGKRIFPYFAALATSSFTANIILMCIIIFA